MLEPITPEFIANLKEARRIGEKAKRELFLRKIMIMLNTKTKHTLPISDTPEDCTMELLTAIGRPDQIRYELDRLAAEGFGFILARQMDYEVKGEDGVHRRVGHWHCTCPTMRLNNIPQAFHTDPVLAILACEAELRKYLANKQYHHKNTG